MAKRKNKELLKQRNLIFMGIGTLFLLVLFLPILPERQQIAFAVDTNICESNILLSSEPKSLTEFIDKECNNDLPIDATFDDYNNSKTFFKGLLDIENSEGFDTDFQIRNSNEEGKYCAIVTIFNNDEKFTFYEKFTSEKTTFAIMSNPSAFDKFHDNCEAYLFNILKEEANIKKSNIFGKDSIELTQEFEPDNVEKGTHLYCINEMAVILSPDEISDYEEKYFSCVEEKPINATTQNCYIPVVNEQGIISNCAEVLTDINSQCIYNENECSELIKNEAHEEDTKKTRTIFGLFWNWLSALFN